MAGAGRKRYIAVRIEEDVMARWQELMEDLKDMRRAELPAPLSGGVTHSALMDLGVELVRQRYLSPPPIALEVPWHSKTEAVEEDPASE